MSHFLLPPYKAYIKTDTGKIVAYARIKDSEIRDNELYLIWQEVYYGTEATFRERVVATADTTEELANERHDLPRGRFKKSNNR